MKSIIILTLLAFSLCGFHLGRCPYIQREKGTFQAARYLGKWYEQARDKAFAFGIGECGQAEYSLNEKNTINVHNSELRKKGRSFADGEAQIVDNFRLAVSFGSNPLSKIFKGDYQILKTDYENYSVVYSCSNLVFARFQLVWILSRTPVLDRDIYTDLVKFANAIGFKNDQLHITNQTADFCGY
jgi:apolipoprotein D and lipocalin family protein